MHMRLFLPKPNIIFGSYEMGWTVDNLNVVHNNKVPDNTKENISMLNFIPDNCR